MKRIVEIDEKSGLESFLGQEVILLCLNYFYAGKLVGVNENCVELEDARLVYETGAWDQSGYTDAQKLPSNWFVKTDVIESFGLSK